MLDTQSARLDLADAHRRARSSRGARLIWNDVPLDLDAVNSRLVLDGRVAIALERVAVRLPSGREVAGPILARCPLGCGRRVRVLWACVGRRGVVACRACALVEYATASTRSEWVRARIAHERLLGRLGLTRPWQTFERRPFQRSTTYERLVSRLDRARRRLVAASASEGRG